MEIVNWKELKREDIYCCFSFPLYKFIVAHGLQPIAKETHKKTNRIFSVFMKGDRLQELLAEWTANRPTKSESGDELDEERKD